ncbi:hypothetical protein LJR186_001207 [Microbacterium foliorum]
MSAAIEAVVAERARQEAKWGEQNHPDGTGANIEIVPLWYGEDLAEWAKASTDSHAQDGTVTWGHILLEEVAEAFAESDPELLRAELVQVAAVAVQWVEAIDRSRAEVPC